MEKKSLPTRGPVMTAIPNGCGHTIHCVFISPKRHKVETGIRSTVEQYMRWYNGEHVQSVWPLMDPDTRELFVTGMGPAEWEEMFNSL